MSDVKRRFVSFISFSISDNLTVVKCYSPERDFCEMFLKQRAEFAPSLLELGWKFERACIKDREAQTATDYTLDEIKNFS